MLDQTMLIDLLNTYWGVHAEPDGPHTIRLRVLAPHKRIVGVHKTYRARVDLRNLLIRTEGQLLKFWDGKGHGHTANEIVKLVAFQ